MPNIWVQKERTPEEKKEFEELLKTCTSAEKEHAQIMWDKGVPMDEILYYTKMF